MILQVRKTQFLSNLKDFEEKYGTKEWLEKNIQLFDNHIIGEEMIDDILKTYFADYKGIVSILKGPGGWIVSEYIIKYAVVINQTIIPCNTIEAAKEMYQKLAIRQLISRQVYKTYPKDKIDYSVLQNMIRTENINLQLIGEI
jgi:hypothetical protein